MTTWSPPTTLHHYVAGRRIVISPTRSVTVEVATGDSPIVVVPVASTAEVDAYVEELSCHLARWMARSAAERRQAVRRIAQVLLDHRAEIESHVAALNIDLIQLSAQLEESARSILDVVEHARTHPGDPKGIVAFVLDSNRAGALMLPSVADVLVNGGVVIVTSSPRLAAGTRGMSDAFGAALPPGVFNEIYGDEETADALTSNPLVAAVYVDGDERTVEKTVRLAELHRKPGVVYIRR